MDLEDFQKLSDAVDEGNQDLIKSILSKNNIPQNQFSGNLESLLCIIAERGTIETAAKMCELGLDINFRNRLGRTPIMHAIKHSKEMVKLFLNHGASLDIKSNYDITPLHEALYTGSEEIVQELLNKIFADKQTGDTFDPITVHNREEMVKALLHNKLELGLRGHDYPLLLLFAASIGDTELFKLTLDDCRKNVDYMKEIEQEQQQLESQENVARLPEGLNVQGIYKRTALHYAVRRQLSDVVLFLLNSGANVECRTENGLSPLDYAVNLGNVEICQILLNFEAEVNPSFFFGPLYFAGGRNANLLSTSSGEYYFEEWTPYLEVTTKHYECPPDSILSTVKLLLQNKANPDAPTASGCTPLMTACWKGLLDVVKLLLEFNANIRIRDDEGNSVLHYAVLSEDFKVIDFLIEKGLDIEDKNEIGSTPLMFAVEHDTGLKMVEYLVDKGADVNARAYDGITALLTVSCIDWIEWIDCLLSLGASYKLDFNWSEMLYEHQPRGREVPGDFKDGERLIIAFHAMKEETMDVYTMSYIQNLCHNLIIEGRTPTMNKVINMIDDEFTACKLELTKMKSTKIVENGRYSLYDFLTSSIYFAVKIIKVREVRTAFNECIHSENFPCYKFMLDMRTERVESLEADVDKMADFMNYFGRVFRLPIVIVDMILNFFNATDFRNFGRFLF